MLVKENFGNSIMTKEFAKYVNAAGFEPVFCMPYDPGSKEQLEAVVKYVMNNFLAGLLSTSRSAVISATASAVILASRLQLPSKSSQSLLV